MRTEVIRDTRLLDALEYIDDAYIASAARYKMKYAPASADEPKITWRTPLKHIKIYIALAASLLLLGMASPLVSFFTYVVSNFTAGAGSGTTGYLESIDSETTESTENNISYKHVLTQEEYDEMNAAWKKFHRNENINIVRSLDEFTYYYPCQGFVCIYMKKDDLVVFTVHTSTDIYDEMTVAGYLFKLPNAEKIWVYKDQNYYSLTKAYNSGILSTDDIRELSEIHYEHRYGENKYGLN